MSGTSASAEGNETRLEFILADSSVRPSPYDADGNVVEGYKAGTYFDDIDRDYAYLKDLDDASETNVLLDGAEFRLDYCLASETFGWDTCKSLTCISGGLDAKGLALGKGRIRFYLPDDAGEWRLYLVDGGEGYVDDRFCWYDDLGELVLTGNPDDVAWHYNKVDSCLSGNMSSDGQIARHEWDGSLDASFGVWPVWNAYSGISTYGGWFASEEHAYSGRVLYNDAVAVSGVEDDTLELKFIKADSRGKPPKSFADGSMYTEGGEYVPGPSYEELEDQGYLLNGSLFELTYWYYDSNGKFKSGCQACWSGGVASDNWTEDHEAYDSVNSYIVEHDDLLDGEIAFELPASTIEWELHEIIATGGYDCYSLCQYADIGIMHIQGLDYWWHMSIRGSDYDRDSDSWTTFVRYLWNGTAWPGWSMPLIEENPWYAGVSTYGGVDSNYDYAYTGNVLWNDLCVKLEFIKANADYRPDPFDEAGNFIEGYAAGTFNNDDVGLDYAYLSDLDNEYGDVLVDGCMFRLSYSAVYGYPYGSSVCYSGGRDAYGALVDDGLDAAGNEIEKGKVLYYVPLWFDSWSLYEVMYHTYTL